VVAASAAMFGRAYPAPASSAQGPKEVLVVTERQTFSKVVAVEPIALMVRWYARGL
jgi:hypothetical protein